mgnify:FL=1
MITFRSDFHRLTFCLPTEHTAIRAELPKNRGGRKKENPSPPEQRELYGENISGFSEVTIDLDMIRGLCHEAARNSTGRVHAGPVTIIFRGERTVITEKELTNHA